MIPKTSVKNGSFYVKKFGKIQGLEEIKKVNCDCTVTVNKSKNKYWLNKM
jgi:hypothetical protein